MWIKNYNNSTKIRTEKEKRDRKKNVRIKFLFKMSILAIEQI